MFGLPLLCTLLILVRVLGHDVLEMAPQRFNRGEFSADLSDFLEGSIQLVDVLEDEFEALEARSVSCIVERTAVCSGVYEMRGGGFT